MRKYAGGSVAAISSADGPGGVERVPRDLAGRGLRGVAADRRLVQLGQRLPGGPVGDQHQVGALPVAAARREPGVVEDPGQYVVGQRVVGELPDRRGRPHHVVELHAPSLPHVNP